MIKTIQIPFLGALSLILATITYAAEPQQGYIGIGYGDIEQDDRFGIGEGSGEFDTGELFIKLGGVISDYLSGELRLGSSLSSSEGKVAGQTIKFRHNYWAGAYLRLQYPTTAITPFIQVGQAYIKETFESPNSSIVTRFSDSSFAGGADINIGPKLILTGEYFLLSDHALQQEMRSGPAISLSYKF